MLQRPDPSSKRPAVEMLHLNFFQVDSIETTNINCRHPIAFRIDTFAKRMDAAGRAKAMFNDMLVERVGADIVFRRNQAHLIARHKPQERAFTAAHGAIARHRAGEFAFDFKGYLAAVTATFVLHGTTS